LSTFFSTARFALAVVAAAVVFGSPAVRAQSAGEQTIDGIRCDASEGALFHIHQHVTILDHGKAIDIPDDVGRPITGECLYWMHTHTSDGIIHIESPVFRSFTLGNFFDVWGQPLSLTAVGPARAKKGQIHIFVGGRPYHGDPRAIEMTLHADIVLEVGPPYVKPAPFTNWQGN